MLNDLVKFCLFLCFKFLRFFNNKNDRQKRNENRHVQSYDVYKPSYFYALYWFLTVKGFVLETA